MKRWAVAHALVFCVSSTCGWYLVLLFSYRTFGALEAFLMAFMLAIGLVWLTGWWRESGLRWQPPATRWLLGLPPLAISLPQLGSVPLTLAAAHAVSVEVASRGLAQFALRRFGIWRVSAVVAVLYAPADLLLVPAAPPGLALATGFCLSALRWRLNSVWPLVAVHFALLQMAGPKWWLPLSIALTAYGCWLLVGYPSVRMANRPTVRVLCFDDQGRVLLLCWHDPSDGTCAWDAPGGGIEPGETALEAARREFHEETGLPGNCVLDRQLPARRDAHWNNMRFVGVEPYFLARVTNPPELTRAGLEPHETRLIRELRWVVPDEATALPGRVQLGTLADLAGRLNDVTG